jgi:hypothetical protein
VQMPDSYPLAWPPGRDRTPRYRVKEARFSVNFRQARDHVLEQLRLLGASYPVLSSNVHLRRDGLPYANQPEPDDSGVAVYFVWRGRQYCLACDVWKKVKDNLRAIGLTVEAIRSIERWGAETMLEAAFNGFLALPIPEDLDWWGILGVRRDEPLEQVENKYRSLALRAHPDRGGSQEQMARLNRAIEQARREKGATKPHVH